MTWDNGDHDRIDNLIEQLLLVVPAGRSDVDLMRDAAEELKRYQELLNQRDKFICDKGLFDEFLQGLPTKIIR